MTATGTIVHIHTRDAQNTKQTLSFRVTDADFGAGVNLPTNAQIEALITDLFAAPATGTPSTSVVTGYSVEVENMFAYDAVLGGDGTVATAIAAKTRSGIGVTGRVGPLGPEGEEFKIPGMNKDALRFMPNAPDVINMTGAPWTAIRTVLVALGYRSMIDGTAFTTSTALETGVGFNGKRAPQRIR